MPESARKDELSHSGSHALAMSLELMVIPVSDPDRSKSFYQRLGWHCDLDYLAPDGYRVIQFTPHGSPASVMFGTNITTAAPGSFRGPHLAVADLVATRAALLSRGIEVGAPFHDSDGVFHHAQGSWITEGPNPQRKSYASYASFSDPDGNMWTLQEITARLGPDLRPGDARFTEQLVRVLAGS